MSADRGRRIDRDTSERLLDGRFGDPALSDDPLAMLLSAAAAPATERELAGEQAVLAAFREAHPAAGVPTRRGSMIKPVLAKVLTTKLAVAAAVTTAIGGGAVVAAASTGNLPLGTGHSGAGGAQDPHGHVGRPAQSAAAHPTGGSSGTAAQPSPSMFGLCQAYTHGVAESNGKALDNPAFSVLIRNAGGRDKVAAYCATVVANGPGNGPSAHPTGEGRPSGLPTPSARPHPTDHPTGQPTDHPTGQPTDHPTGQAGDHGGESHP